ncbi:hypothetical protein pb186bvf_011472 [Paramecium bursaria]
MVFFTNYISKKGESNILNFKYNGQCDSILYEYFLSPFADYIVGSLPIWLAPNIITLSAFGMLVIALILCLLFMPNGPDELVPNWLCFVCSFAVFAYQNLDNCDGKQARRTNSSSALGMLLDHGSDCMAQSFIGIMMILIMNLPHDKFAFLGFMMCAKVPFFFGVYSLKYTGVFKLARINGVDEGIPIIWTSFLISGIFGPGWWTQDLLFNIKRYQFCISIAYLAGFHASIGFINAVIKVQKWTYYQLIKSMQVPISVAITFINTSFFSPIDFIKDHSILYIFMFSFYWTKTINLLQLSVITKEVNIQSNYQEPDNFSWKILIFVLNANIIFYYVFGIIFDEVLLCWILLFFGIYSYIQCACSLTLKYLNKKYLFDDKIILKYSLFFRKISESTSQFCGSLN